MPLNREQLARLSRRGFLVGAGAGLAGIAAPPAFATGRTSVANDGIRVSWYQSRGRWVTEAVEVRTNTEWRPMFSPAGHYTVLRSDARPGAGDLKRGRAGDPVSLVPVRLRGSREAADFTAFDETGMLRAIWQADPSLPQSLTVTLTWTARRAGYYSVASPTLATVHPDDLRWGVVPGVWTSSVIGETDDDTMYRYGLGVPPVGYLPEETATTSLVAVIEGAHGTLATVAEPSHARDPWPDEGSNHSAWHVSASLRDPGGVLAPTIYSPLLGREGSWLEAGDSVTSRFRVIADPGAWYDVTEAVTQDVYQFGTYLALTRNVESLSRRLTRVHDFVVTPASRWHTWEFRGHQMGAESGKLSDVGAMWMWQRLTGDPFIADERLPYARGFKLAQQGIAEDGPFDGAALGEYFRSGKWISEIVWADRTSFGEDYVSPMFTTFYTLADGGNILLFDPQDDELRQMVHRAAEKLLAWQHDDGSFDIGYERESPQTVKYPELRDLRATWYGLVVAHKVLDDERYLEAARRGADWFIEHAVATGNILGVCDDARLIRDFHVIFAAQALLDLYEATGSDRYMEAAIAAATLYTTHVFDHPIATEDPKSFNGHEVKDWQLSQVGLVYEHAGTHGSVRGRGPITLSSHAGAFVRFHELTGRQIFLDMARASARGRHEWVGPETGISSYYWNAGNAGSTAYPWHGWWHIGWVMDYLLAEAHLRTDGQIEFPHGFCTAKVGSHRPYGFAVGGVFGQQAQLRLPRTLVTVDTPHVEWITAVSPDESRLFVIALNESPEPVEATLAINPRAIRPGERASWGATSVLSGSAATTGDDTWNVSLLGDGVVVFAVDAAFAVDPEGPELRALTVDGAEQTPTVAWSFWANVTSWIEWRVGDTDWTALPPVSGHSHTATLDLRGLELPATVEIRVATELPDGIVGHSEPVVWMIPLLGPNIAFGVPVAVSSVYDPRYPGSNLVDGNTTSGSSRWLSALGDDRPTATFTLPGVTTPRLLRLYTGLQLAQIVHAWTVQARTAAGEWVEIASVSENASLRRDVPLDPVETDQVRVVITGRSRDQIDVARVFEIEIYDVYEV